LSRPAELLGNPEFIADLNSSLSGSAIATKWGIGKTQALEYRRRLNVKDGLPAKDKVAALAADVILGGQSKDVSSKGKISMEKRSDRIIPLSEWLKDLRADGYDPDDFNTSHGHSVWGQQPRDGELVTLYANKFSAVKKTKKEKADEDVDYSDIDPTALLAELRAGRTRTNAVDQWCGDESAFVLNVNDIQLGQSYNGGSAATIKQFYGLVEGARKRIIELRSIGRALETLVVVFGGDLVEGCVIYGNQAFSLDLHRKQQIEGVIALTLHLLDTLAPMFKHVKVLAAKGNHGENRIDGKYTTLGDNDDTHSVEMAKLALSRDADMQHIDWVIAEDEAGVAMNVYDWVLATTHGDIFAKGVAGPTIDKKAHAWLKNMALARDRFGMIGRADILITHHFHHEKGSDWGSCLWRQTPSQDRGSPYFEQATGEYSEPGMLTAVISRKRRWADEEVLRIAS
jgi:hypothetical protein